VERAGRERGSGAEGWRAAWAAGCRAPFPAPAAGAEQSTDGGRSKAAGQTPGHPRPKCLKRVANAAATRPPAAQGAELPRLQEGEFAEASPVRGGVLRVPRLRSGGHGTSAAASKELRRCRGPGPSGWSDCVILWFCDCQDGR